MKVSTIIKASMRKLGLIASGETPTDSEYADALEALQSMLRSWSAQKINVFATVREDITLTSGTASYTWGTTGDITTTRPTKVLSGTVQDSSGNESPLEIISSGQYNGISNKSNSGMPYMVYVTYTFPLATMYLYPVPDSGYTITLNSIKPFTETDSFAAITNDIAMPVIYEEPIVYNLAVRIAPEFGTQVSQEVVAIAQESYNRITTVNSSNYIEPAKLSFPIGLQASYNINLDR